MSDLERRDLWGGLFSGGLAIMLLPGFIARYPQVKHLNIYVAGMVLLMVMLFVGTACLAELFRR